MTNRAKQKGTSHESAIVTWLRAHGWPYASRKTQAGAADEGDVRLSERVPYVIEAKNTQAASIGPWMKELEAEVRNAKADGGAVIWKKRGTTDVGEYYAIMPVKYLNTLLTTVYPETRWIEGPAADQVIFSKRPVRVRVSPPEVS